MYDGKRRCRSHDAAVAVATPITKHEDVAGPRLFHLCTTIEDKAQIALVAAVQMPVRRIGPRIERRTKSSIDEDANNQHAAINANAMQIGAIMIRRSNPAARFGDDGGPFLCFRHGIRSRRSAAE
jgi:hypothetical protein